MSNRSRWAQPLRGTHRWITAIALCTALLAAGGRPADASREVVAGVRGYRASSIFEPGDISQISLASTFTGPDGWRYERYVNYAYPCSIDGYQSFVIGTPPGSSATATAPLWVKMRGGGAGWFDKDGPQPTEGGKTKESFEEQLRFDTPGLMAAVKESSPGFRVLIVSMCSHDIYAGNNTSDPYNRNRTNDGRLRTTNGLVATTAAIRYTVGALPTDDFFLHGTSAGGVGSFHVAWALQGQGLAPAGVVSDSGVSNREWQQYVAANGIPGSVGCEKATAERGLGVFRRIDPKVSDSANEPHLLVADGRLTVPIVHVWNHADSNVCGATLIPCPVPDGSQPMLGAADCNHEPMRLAIDNLDASSHSMNMAVCVEGTIAEVDCDRHVVTTLANGASSTGPADYQGKILKWVLERLGDD
jgi:hypothetical protein